MAIMALHGLVVYRIIGPCGLAVVSMHMDIASMVLAVRAGCAPRWPNPPRPGHCLCVSLNDFTWP